MSNIIPFNYEDSEVRVIMVNDEPWWVASDVCKILNIINVGQAVENLDDDEKNTLSIGYSIRGNPNKIVVNEPGLYQLIFVSHKPEAKAFKRWVTHNVLPSIRKTGSYTLHETPVQASPVQGGVATELADMLKDPKTFKKYVHVLNGLQELLYPNHIQEVPTQHEKLKNDIIRVLNTRQTPMTAAILHGSWIKNVDTQTIQSTLDDLASEGILTKAITNSAKQGKYSLA
jgi:prophage antirepressor-like protein